jgi:hypothetical protein
MPVSVVFSIKDLHKLHRLTNPIEIDYDGGRYRARLSGSNVVGFGETTLEAEQRLRILRSMQRVCKPKSCDLDADRAERRCTL